jgi:DNA-binding HxlR family transcriptional regulator
LEKLLQREQIVADAVAATGELRAALGKLADLVVARRLEALEEKSRSTRLEPEELLEFQRLMLHRVPRDARGG